MAEALVVEKSQDEKAKEIVKNYMYWTMGAGLIPYPLVDLAAVIGIQIKMTKDLAELYEVPFRENAAKTIIGSLLGGITSSSLAFGSIGLLAASLVKMVPIIGTAPGLITVPLISGAVTYAVGRVFIMHFETGGTLLDFDPAKVREHFREALKEGEKVAKEMKK
jgi:uncharacterized protein (DUF697 family)